MYVDDTNLWEGMRRDDDRLSVAAAGQDAINSWNGNLQATGGALNPDKCAFTIHDMVPTAEGDWEYSDQLKKNGAKVEEEDDGLEELDDIQITITQSNGDVKAIKQLTSYEAVENLGFFARPDGNPEPHFKKMVSKIDTWIGKVKAGTLPTRSVWTTYIHQLWAGLKYGLAASSATIDQLETGLGKSDHKLLSCLGVARSIATPVRYFPQALNGIGLRSLVTETATAQINAFLQHWDAPTSMGVSIRYTLEQMQLEMGVPDCPLYYDFQTWGCLTTNCWIKSLWEKLGKLDIKLHVDYPPTKPPWERDKCIMQALLDAGVNHEDWKVCNKVRKHQQAMWLSCISVANGSGVDPLYLYSWRDSWEGSSGESRSQSDYGSEWPTEDDWNIWRQAWRTYSMSNRLTFLTRLGKQVDFSPRKWRVYYYKDDDHAIIDGY